MGMNKRYAPCAFAYTVEIWSDDDTAIEQTVAEVNHLLVARGAYQAACDVHPKARLKLRQGARVLEVHEPASAGACSSSAAAQSP